ncbi:MAG TPA: MBL fold metallo-hydrolase [Terriglobales bacterium]|jgi:L-ascorbate metabolism protein UlaG (beta-lactamase superfamily)
MRLRLIRHATLIIEYHGRKILLDPMLDDAGARPAIENTPNARHNPLVPLPEPIDEILKGVECILVTHTHMDHWDGTAAQVIPKHLPLFGQVEDERKFRSAGFTSVQPIRDKAEWNGIQISRTGGQHGTGEIAKMLAPVSGFVLNAPGEPSLYVAGDTIWCAEVEQALNTFEPSIIVLNAGAARFLQGDPITMTSEDVIRVCKAAPHAQVVPVHMESINHCLLTRADLAFQLEAARVSQQVAIPGDGEWVETRVDGR